MSDEKAPPPWEWPIPPAELPSFKRYVQGLYGMGVDGTAQILRLIRTIEDSFTEAEVREAMIQASALRLRRGETAYVTDEEAADILSRIRKARGG